MRTPTWGEIERFCRIDGWRESRRTDHVFFEKVLADGTVLRTHHSFAVGKTMSPGRFKDVLRSQLQVSEDDFWAALKTKEPVARPSAPPAEEVDLPAYVFPVLRDELHLSEAEMQGAESLQRTPFLDCGADGSSVLRPPPRALRVLDPRRGLPDPRARRSRC